MIHLEVMAPVIRANIEVAAVKVSAKTTTLNAIKTSVRVKEISVLLENTVVVPVVPSVALVLQTRVAQTAAKERITAVPPEHILDVIILVHKGKLARKPV
jgi:hypothetical protein